MSSTFPTLFQAKHVLQRVPLVVRVLLHAAVLFVVAVFPCGTPTLGSRAVTESEAPVDQDETSQEKDISLQAGTRIRRKQPGVRLPVSNRVGPIASTRTVVAPRSGHRLSHDLLAPLRC